MLNKPIPIAAIATLLASIPLYYLSVAGFELTTSNLPVLLLSLFILSLVSAYWGSLAINRAKSSARQSRGPETHSAREGGKVKWFNANKGFGFITRDVGDDIFVHFRSIRGDGHRILRDGQRVDFVVSEGEKGLQAEDVATAR